MTPLPPTLASSGEPEVPTAAAVASEIMLLPDGRILAHHLTPEIAALLNSVAGSSTGPETPSPSPPVDRSPQVPQD